MDNFSSFVRKVRKLELHQQKALFAMYSNSDLCNALGSLDPFEILFASGLFDDFIEDIVFNQYEDYEIHVATHIDQFIDIIKKYEALKAF